jgi:hypothetical protein
VVAVIIYSSGGERIQAQLSRRSGLQLNKDLRTVTQAAANVAKPIIAAGAPVRKVGGGATKRSVSVRGVKPRPGSATGVSVGPRIWYRHFVIGGTSRGIEANPWVQRGIDRAAPAVRATLNSGLKAASRLP